MKRIKTLLVGAACLAISTSYAENTFSISVPTLTPGSPADITINLDNSDMGAGFEFILILPEGISVNDMEDYDWTDRTYISNKDNWSFEMWEQPGASNEIHVVGYTTKTELAPLGVGEDPGVMIITVQVASSYTGGAFGFDNYGSNVPYNDFTIGETSLEPKFVGTFNGTKTLTLGANGYSSYSECAPVQVSGATVKGATISGDKLTLSGSGSVVPANTGVILKGTEGATVTITAAESAGPIATDLAAAVVPTTVEANKTMVLSTKSSVTGFYKFTGTTITANKAYLPSVPTSAPLRIVEDETTGIEEVESEANVGFNYNLMGQQIKSQKGFVIENGKKVVRF